MRMSLCGRGVPGSEWRDSSASLDTKVGGNTRSTVIIPIITAVTTALLMLPVQYIATKFQVREELNSWHEKEYTKKGFDDQQRRKRLVADFRQMHEELMSADTVFIISSQMMNLQEALERYKGNVDQRSREKVDAVFSRIASNLGLAKKEQYFAEYAQKYSDKRAKLIGMLSEVDFYFSSDVMIAVNEYYRHTSSGDGDMFNEVNKWDDVARYIVGEASKGNFDKNKIASAVLPHLGEAHSRLEITVALYNRVYQAMRNEIIAKEKGEA